MDSEDTTTVPAPPQGSAGRSRMLVMSLVALLLSVVLLVVAVVMAVAGGSERSDAREARPG